MDLQLVGPVTQLGEGKAWRAPRNGIKLVATAMASELGVAAESARKEVKSTPAGNVKVPPPEGTVRKPPRMGKQTGADLTGVIYAVSPVIAIGHSDRGAKSFFLVELRLPGPEPLMSASGSLLMSATESAFLYLEGESGVRWRPECVSNAGRTAWFRGVKKRVMVGQGGSERVLYTAGGCFRVEFEREAGENKLSCGRVRGSKPDGTAARCGLPGEVSVKGVENVVKEGGVTRPGGLVQGEENPPHENGNGFCGHRKGLPQSGTLCYVGVVTGVWPPGLVIELDGRVNLLLPHYPVTQISGLTIGSLLAAWHVVPVLNGQRVVALGACIRSLITVVGYSNPLVSTSGLPVQGKSQAGFETGLANPEGLDVRLAGQGHPLRQLCDRLPFPTALWMVELDRILRLKLTGGVMDDAIADRGSGGELSESRYGVRVPNGMGLAGSNGRNGTLLQGPTDKLGVSRGLLNLVCKPTEGFKGLVLSATPTHAPKPEAITNLVREITEHYLPGFKALRQRRDVFEEFMSRDAQSGLGGGCQGWKEPPEVLPISSLLERVKERGRTAVVASERVSERVSAKELGIALLGMLKVDPDSGRAVMADATGSVRIRVLEQLEAVHLNRWMLVDNFSADVRSLNNSEPSEVSVSFSLADAVLMSAPLLNPPPRQSRLAIRNRRDAPKAFTVDKGTWVRPDVQSTDPAENRTGLREADTWQTGSCKARQVPGWPNHACVAAGGQKERAKETPFWIVVVVSKTAMAKEGDGLRFVAEAVVLPRVLRLPRRADVRQGLGDGLRVPRTVSTNPDFQNPKPPVTSPRSGLVRSYHRAPRNEVRQTSGPPWLADRAEIPRDSQTAPAADTCLFMPAWERSNKISNRVSNRVSDRVSAQVSDLVSNERVNDPVSTRISSGFASPSINSAGMPSDAPVSLSSSNPSYAPKEGVGLGRANNTNPLSVRGVNPLAEGAESSAGKPDEQDGAVGGISSDSPQTNGPRSERAYAESGFKMNGRDGYRAPGSKPRAVVGSAALARMSVGAPGGQPRATFGRCAGVEAAPESVPQALPAADVAVRTAPESNPWPVLGTAGAVQAARESNPRALLDATAPIRTARGSTSRALPGAAAAVQKSLDSNPRAVVGAASAVRLSDGIPRQAKRLKWSETPVKKTESVKCSVYWQSLGATGRTDQELERGPRLNATLEKLEPLNLGADFGVNVGFSGTRKKFVGEARVMLVFSGSAALLYDVIHVGRSYVIPAPQASSNAADTNSEPATGPLPAPNYVCPRLPVIDLTDGELVHSCQLVSDPAPDSIEPEGVSEAGRRDQASLVLELPGRVYKEALPFLDAQLPTLRTHNPASGDSGSSDAAESVLLRGRVVAVLELQLGWGCPFCGSSAAASDAIRTLRAGCARCCAAASEYTVLVREACFAFDDGASQCEVWVEGSAAAGLLALPYVPAETLFAETLVRQPAASRPQVRFDPGSYARRNPSEIGTTGLAEPSGTQMRPLQDSSSKVVSGETGLVPNLRVGTPGTAAGLDSSVGSGDFDARACENGQSPRQHMAGLPTDSTVHANPLEARGGKKLLVGDSHAAREALIESVKKGTSKAAQYEPDALFQNLHRCLLDTSKLEMLVKREDLVRVKANATGAADGSFLAAQLEISGAGGRPLPGADREGLEVLVASACRRGQQGLTCVPLPSAPAERSRFLTKEQGVASGGGRCRVYLSGQVYEIHAPVVARYRAVKAEAVAPSVQAAALCKLLSESDNSEEGQHSFAPSDRDQVRNRRMAVGSSYN